MIRNTIIVLISFLISVMSVATVHGSSSEDVVYLKNGSVIRGQIVEIIPDEKISIRLAGGSVLVYRFDEIERIEKQQVIRVDDNPYKNHRKFGSWGLIGSWGLTVLGSAAMGDEMVGTTVIPVAGPFITMSRIEGGNGTYLPGGKSLLTISGVTQSAFLVYTVYSAFAESNYNSKHNFAIIPHVQDVGVSMVIRF